MCTLTYRLTDVGYELFFNRDEQRSRTQALAPKIDSDLNAIFPIDPVGKGTWLATHQNGLSLALLNYYQAEKSADSGDFISRGEIILKLLATPDNVVETLKSLPLQRYQAFQLVFFPDDLNLFNQQVHCFQWDGIALKERQQSLPITSSSVDYPEVYQARKKQFEQSVNADAPSSEQLNAFHQYQQQEGKLSVKMFREDAKTVSFSHICVEDNIVFTYDDYIDDQQHLALINRST